MICSLNEIDAHVKKAARGSGLAWGLAEEAGKAARWLEGHRLDSLPLFAALLEAGVNGPLRIADDVWRAEHGALHPIIAGAALSDQAAQAVRPITLADVVFPMLLVPFAVLAVRATGTLYALRWDAVIVSVTPDNVSTLGTGLRAASADVRCYDAPASGRVLHPMPAGVPVDDTVWARLDVLAKRTYVPASDISRRRGAGAGMIDND